MAQKAVYHLPGLFEFYPLYRVFLPLYRQHPEYFYDWCEIGSLYGAPAGCLWGGGRLGLGQADPRAVLALTKEYGIAARLTFSNSLLTPEHLADPECNALCALFEGAGGNGAIVHSDLLVSCLQSRYPGLALTSSTTKVLTEFADFARELARPEFAAVVPDFRLNKAFGALNALPPEQKAKVEFLCNECCWVGCRDRAACYRAVSRQNLGLPDDHRCTAPGGAEGYRFTRAMESPAFIGPEDIRSTYLPMGFFHFKIEGRGLGSALVLEFLLHYLAKPQYHLHLREAIYLDSMLDLF